ncbi:MAG: hypothetical protein AABO58_22895 [Acidobacteriota bacterium]
MASATSQITPSKLRIRALDQSGKPAAFIRVELVAAVPGTAATDAVSAGTATPASTRADVSRGRPDLVAVRSLTTSRDGFAIFSLGNIPAKARASGDLRIRFAGRPELTFAIPDYASAGGTQYVGYQLPTGSWGEPEPVRGPWLDDGLDLDDVWVTPGVFPDLGHLAFGDEYCGRLIPNDLTVRIFHRNQVVRTKKNVVTCLTGADQTPSLDEGELINYEVKATRLGYTFGDLLYSLPLAPCESVTLAISHWEQRQKARAEQESVSIEKRSSSYYRQNALSETMNAVSSSRHFGLAYAGGVSALVDKIAQVSVAVSVSASFDRKQFASDATRTFSDSIQESAEAWRSDHQVVVMEQWETEDQAVSYRTVCNNNHCHVLNIFYHEVLNNFRVTTKLLGHRDVYLVPYDVNDFDAHLAVCAKPFLLPYLLDKDLTDCYQKLKYVGAGSRPGAGGKIVNHFKVEMNFFRAFGFHPQWPFDLVVKLKVGGLQFFPIVRNDYWITGTTYAYAVDTPDFDPDNIQSVGVRNATSSQVLHSGGLGSLDYQLAIQSLTVSMRDRASTLWLPVGTRSGFMDLRGLDSRDGDLYLVDMPQTPAAPALPPAPGAAAADEDCLDQVLAHLNCNKIYYSALLALLEDPNARICRFDKIICGTSGESLADLIVPEPVAIFGCSLAFPKAGSAYVPDQGAPIVDERLVTLPTPGIFADAALGQCSACETIDDKVYWDWSKTPCTCAGKDVTLKAPEASPLFLAGTSPFPGLATGVWATGVTPPSGETAITNSLVGAFGGAMATAMLSGKDAEKELAALKDLLDKMTAALKDLTKKTDPPKDPPK